MHQPDDPIQFLIDNLHERRVRPDAAASEDSISVTDDLLKLGSVELFLFGVDPITGDTAGASVYNEAIVPRHRSLICTADD